ncbi:hypothetical protein NL676_005598 [Syzygium grande]|nr:hypothetical protein NL676_005598 [Syzygium grande]
MPPATSATPSSPPSTPRTLPVCATLFVAASTNAAVCGPVPLSLLFNVVPRHLAFSQLKLLNAGSRLPTLLFTTPSPSLAALPVTSTSTDALSLSLTSSPPTPSPCTASPGSSITQSRLEEIIG